MILHDNVIDMLAKFSDEHREYNYAAVLSNGFGGWDIRYCKTKAEAEQVIKDEGKNSKVAETEVVSFVD